MKKTSNLCSFLCGVLVSVMLMSTAAAASGNTKKMIEANYRDIKLVVDGIEVTPKDANGNVVEPFISDGTTYLPVRAVAEALGKEVTWDGATKTVYIGKVPGTEENWMTKLPPYQVANGTIYNGSDPKAFFSVAGETHTHGIVLQNPYNKTPFAIWNTNCQYDTMTITIGHMGNGTWSTVLEVYLDGVYFTEYSIPYDAAPKTINIPLNAAPNVKLSLRYDFSFGHGLTDPYGIYDISFS